MSYSGAILRVLPTLPLGRGTDPFGLTEGQMLRGVVLRSGGGAAEVLLQGQVLQLRTELSLVAGSPIALQVREVGAQGIMLGLAPEVMAAERGQATTAAASATRALTTDDLRDLALALRLPASDRTLTILRELMANGRPLTFEAVQTTLLAARAAGAEGAAMLRPLVWLLARGLPATPTALDLARSALPEGEPLPSPALPGALPAARVAQQARVVDSLLARAIPTLPPAAHAPALGVRAALARLGLAGPSPEPTPAEGIAVRLAALAEGVATPVEAKLARLLASAPAAQANAPEETAAPTSSPTAGAAGRGAPPTDGASHNQPPVSQAVADLRVLIERTLRAINEPTSPGDHSSTRAVSQDAAGRAAVVEALTTLATGLEFSQLANAARPEADRRQTVWLPLPLPPGADGQPPSLAVSRWGGGEASGAPRRLRATVALSLQHLGDLTVHLDLTGRHLRCDLRAAGPGLAAIEPEVAALTERLAALGFEGVEAVAAAALSSPPLTAPPLRRLDQRA